MNFYIIKKIAVRARKKEQNAVPAHGTIGRHLGRRGHYYMAAEDSPVSLEDALSPNVKGIDQRIYGLQR